MLCIDCSSVLASEAKFCHQCGAKADSKAICSGCHAKINRKYKFCPECGEAIATIAVEQGVIPRPISTYLLDQPHFSYHFFDSLQLVFFTPLLSRLVEPHAELHDFIASQQADNYYQNIKTGVEHSLVEIDLQLQPLLSHESRGVLLNALQRKTQLRQSKLFDSLQGFADTTKLMLSAIPEHDFENLIDCINQGIANKPHYNEPFDMLEALVVSISKLYQQSTRPTKQVNDYLTQYQLHMRSIDSFWGDFYCFIEQILNQSFAVSIAHQAEIEVRFAKYQEHLEKTEAYMESEQYKRALFEIEQALTLCPKAYYPHYVKAELYIALERFDAALQSVQQLSQHTIVAKDILFRHWLYTAYCYTKTNRSDEALAILDWLAKQPEYQSEDSTLFNLTCAFAYDAMHNQQGALFYAQKAIHNGFRNLAEFSEFSTLTPQDIAQLAVALDQTTKHNISQFLFAEPSQTNAFLPFEHLSQEQLNRAKQSYLFVAENEEIIALYDSTFFGGAELGICFSTQAIYLKSRWDSAARFSYDEISHCCYEAKQGLVINQRSFSFSSRNVLQGVARLVNHLCML